MSKPSPIVGVVMGSNSDLGVMQICLDQLAKFGVPYEVRIISAHRTPDVAHEYSSTAVERGLKVIIAAAGMSAALAGVLASKTTLPVLGVPMASGPMAGVDAALSTMQMPNGIPVACMAVAEAGAANAAIFATQILALADPALEETMKQHKQTLIEKTIQRDQALQDSL